jgi:hypothetical protein
MLRPIAAPVQQGRVAVALMTVARDLIYLDVGKYNHSVIIRAGCSCPGQAVDVLQYLRSAASQCVAEPKPGRLPSGELRFVLEMAEAQNAADLGARLEKLLGSSKIVLAPLFPDDDPPSRFLVLRFPGIERTPPNPVLFDAAAYLASEFSLVSVEPDLGSRIYVDPEPAPDHALIESADNFPFWCWVNDNAPADKRWALKTMRVPEAWALAPGKGAGVIIAQPDTGIATHADVETSALRLDLARDIMDDDADPTDPLDPGAANPGHGTGTASVAISRETGAIAGSAPGAQLVPIRCTDDVKILDATPLAAAIDHARRIKADVITMSLGGFPSRALETAVNRAVASGAIVLAAAGNCVFTVVYPARYDNCTAVAGINNRDAPWKGSCSGSTVDISAPAELVWRAERRSPNDATTTAVSGGQGTSFAVALTAGAAALWIAHHGRDKVRAEAKQRNVSVQRLFTTALRATSRQPHGWDSSEFGAGIVNAEKLLALALDKIPQPAAESLAVGATRSHYEKLLEEIEGPHPQASGFDWTRHGLEVASLLLQEARARHAQQGGVRPEVAGRVAQASRSLLAETARAEDPRLRRLAERRAQPLLPPAPRLQLSVAGPGPTAMSRQLAVLGRRRTGAGALESTGSVTLESAQQVLRDGNATRAIMDTATRALAHIGRQAGGQDAVSTALRKAVVDDGERVLRQFSDGARLARADRIVLEALVQLHGRPALRVRDDAIDPNDPEIGEWQGPLLLARARIKEVLDGVGRIDIDGTHVGTGFLIAPGLVMTNRHVVEEIAAPAPRKVRPASWTLLSKDLTIDFDREFGNNQTRAFRIKSVLFTGPNPISDTDIVDFRNLDLALLEIETTNAAQQKLPNPLRLRKAADVPGHNKNVITVGFPGIPAELPQRDGKVDEEVVSALGRIFDTKFGYKYLAPGVVTAVTGSDPTDERKWVFNHDATTTGGNSGSCVVTLDDEVAVVGLHFAGWWRRANHAHRLAAIPELTDKPIPGLPALDWIAQ